jgi:hypothetical protein
MLAIGLPLAALAGPPFATDDPEPTDLGHYEVYLFPGGASTAIGLARSTISTTISI